MVPDLRAVLALVIAGAGVTVAPRYLAAAALARGELVILHEPARPVTNQLYLATRRQRATPPRVAIAAALLGRAAAGW